jgi:hypothetical protein
MPILTILIIAFIIVSSITVFDTQLNRAKKRGELPSDEPACPSWVALIYWIQMGLAIALLIINWRYAIFVFIICFILGSILPVFEMFGNILMRPFKPKNKIK